MIEKSEALEGNIKWLKSVCTEGSGYSYRFKCFAYKDLKRLEEGIIVR